MIDGISAVTLGTHEMPRAVRFYRAPEVLQRLPRRPVLQRRWAAVSASGAAKPGCLRA
jgi:hypothetical protein